MEQQGWLSKEKVRLPFIFHQGWGILKTFTFRDWFFPLLNPLELLLYLARVGKLYPLWHLMKPQRVSIKLTICICIIISEGNVTDFFPFDSWNSIIRCKVLFWRVRKGNCHWFTWNKWTELERRERREREGREERKKSKRGCLENAKRNIK